MTKYWQVFPLLLSLASCAALPPPATGIAAWTEAHGIAGFENLRWGMTAKQIQNAYPGFVFEPMGAIRGLRVHNYVLAGCQFTVSLTFFDRGNDALTIIGFDYASGDFNACQDQIKSTLLQQYGSNPSIQPGPKALRATYTSWQGPLLSVELREYQQPNAGPALEIEYANTNAPGTSFE